ncbi:4Fe-4S dicluster domain-containing protein [Dysgonomonas massiliensis]|uniref:4Fe-4S dicluster domain-containing protein n=1 Tax=Dysgonomonas massiliensis TaxID=2040292 RepID=UPI000C79203B|nr:4Fe-4S dicluster domain-containing protein [Dysgonomonas massiliensis]
MSTLKNDYISEIKSNTAINVNRCYQCGKCSAGCAVNEEMDYPPSVVMRMLQTNSEEDFNEILHSQSIWLCVSCENCLTRCPMQIDIPKLMDYLREQAIEKNTVNKKSKNILSFHSSFVDSIRLTGRLYEIGLVAEYKMKTLNLLQDMKIAPGMFMKGKLPLLPEIVKNRKQISTIFSQTKK